MQKKKTVNLSHPGPISEHVAQVYQLAWEHLWKPSGELEEGPREREVCHHPGNTDC